MFGFLTSSSTTRLYRGRAPRQRLTSLRAATHETELGDHDFCLSRSHDIENVQIEKASQTNSIPNAERIKSLQIKLGTQVPKSCYAKGFILLYKSWVQAGLVQKPIGALLNGMANSGR